MNDRLKTGILFICFLFLAGCATEASHSSQDQQTASKNYPSALTKEQLATLDSLQKIDEYPLYTMTYFGGYRESVTGLPTKNPGSNQTNSEWACSLFTVLLPEENLLYGRNFDWEYSPALLLFTEPPDGYASVSMVDVAYLGFNDGDASDLTDLPIEERRRLLDAPYLPFDGMNERGLVIGMAAVPNDEIMADADKETIGSLGIMREVLDFAQNVDEAVAIMENYNIDFKGGPHIHYLIADASGRSVLVEYYNAGMVIFENEQPWHLATNFMRAAVNDPVNGHCWRYDLMNERLSDSNGRIETEAAMQLLADIAQDNTQWSVVYQMDNGGITVVMGRQYRAIHHFQLELSSP